MCNDGTKVKPLDAHTAMILASVFDATKWYDKALNKVVQAAYDRYDGPKAWPAPLNEIPNFIGDRCDDVRQLISRIRAFNRLATNDTRSVR